MGLNIETREIEMYFGYTLGDIKLWDTTFVEIPAITPDIWIESVAVATLMRDESMDDMAFYGVYNIPETITE